MSLLVSTRDIFTFCFILAVGRSEISMSNEVTKSLCGLKTDELIKYYGYEAEVHNVTTEDGYILTVFRCNAKNDLANKKPPLMVQHGLLISSDDFCVNTPNEALAYVFADAGFDVWLPNSRGNVYSRNHVSKDPNSSSSGFWDFSWYEMGIYDQSAVMDYILQQTGNTKIHYVGISQGTTALMVLLSEKPEYNEKIHVASLMAPIGYMTNVDVVYKLIFQVVNILQQRRGFEFLPRKKGLNDLITAVCTTDLPICNIIVNFLFGPSVNQCNDTMLPAFMCFFPSGCSIRQFQHYAQKASFGFFGKFMTKPKIPPDFLLSKITTPITLHYTTADKLADAKDVERLIPKLNSVIYVQRINGLNHIDMLWSRNSASVIYSKIIDIFQKYR